MDEHKQHARLVLQRLLENKLFVKAESVVLTLQEWRHWLEGAKQLFVHHKNLSYIR